MSKKIQKTNAMRILDQKKIEYRTMTYEVDEGDLSGEHAAEKLGVDPDVVFKTLVLKGDKTGYIVACIPVRATLDLKALAAVSHNKSVEMIHMKDLLGVTGYIRGGCSQIGMKKLFHTYIDEKAFGYPEIVFSAGMRGLQIVASPGDLRETVHAEAAAITV